MAPASLWHLLRRPSPASRRALSVASTASLSLAHPTTRVTLRASDAARTDVTIVPVSTASAAAHVEARAWTAAGHETDVEQLFRVDVDVAADAQSLRLVKKTADAVDVALELVVPRSVALDVIIANGRVALRDAVEGDVKVVVQHGDLCVHKVRGPRVRLSANHGALEVAALVEGETVDLCAHDGLQCQRLLARRARVKLGKGHATRCSTLGAIYAASCSIAVAPQASRGASQLHVGAVHGHLQVKSAGLDRLQVDSVSGTIDVEDSGRACHVTAHFDSWPSDSCSRIVVAGDVHVSVQPAASMDVELHGTSVTVGDQCVFERSDMDEVDADYAVFTGQLCAREEAVAAATSTGKIDVRSAKQDALRTSFFMQPADGGNEARDESKPSRLFVHAQQGAVTLDQLTWMDNVKRKYVKQLEKQ
ncbi:unnamed protein product [Hyaloperonospora brassicae]|uniref:Adhesin domain-containing protein n=1 Tax=Hyaloperonospora brassicae TaxID=162125 RepID=A0AAV0TFK5_HYABA|nr:unnamed protein product [Hyaloperonospora brassicae]